MKPESFHVMTWHENKSGQLQVKSSDVKVSSACCLCIYMFAKTDDRYDWRRSHAPEWSGWDADQVRRCSQGNRIKTRNSLNYFGI